jgi:hypothetical protein
LQPGNGRTIPGILHRGTHFLRGLDGPELCHDRKPTSFANREKTSIYKYKSGNSSALEWIIDQYQVSTDKPCGITNGPNREDDPQYILRLIGKVISASLETVRLVNELATYPIHEPSERVDLGFIPRSLKQAPAAALSLALHRARPSLQPRHKNAG